MFALVTETRVHFYFSRSIQVTVHDSLSYVHCPSRIHVHVSMSYLYYYVLFATVWDDLDAAHTLCCSIEATTVAAAFVGLLIGL